MNYSNVVKYIHGPKRVVEARAQDESNNILELVWSYNTKGKRDYRVEFDNEHDSVFYGRFTRKIEAMKQFNAVKKERGLKTVKGGAK
jgi:hypothetical protein